MRKYSFYLLLLVFSFQFLPIHAQEWEEEYEEEFQEIFEESSESAEQVFTPHYSKTPISGERPPVYYKQRELDSDFKSKYKGKKYDYDRVVKPPEPINPPNFSIPVGLLKFLMYGLLAILLIVVVYKIIQNAGGFTFGKSKTKIKVDFSDEHELEDVENIESNDFETLIQKAKDSKDYRRAVRYYYLWVLQRLTENKLIDWHKDKTNYDYFLELNQKTIQDDFSNSHYIYDYIWYGNFEFDLTEFNRAESIFKGTLNKLK